MSLSLPLLPLSIKSIHLEERKEERKKKKASKQVGSSLGGCASKSRPACLAAWPVAEDCSKAWDRPGVSNSWPAGRMWSRTAMNAVQHKIVNLFKTL